MREIGYILWSGKSKFDRKPIVVIATMKSRNKKTGDMVQCYIIRSDIDPVSAIQTGDNWSICGDCDIPCYVEVGKSIYTVYQALKRGRYPVADVSAYKLMADRHVRIGAYGDPAAAPINVWRNLIRFAAGWTGYTHQWRKPSVQAYKAFLMASVDGQDSIEHATKLGWRAFKVRYPGEQVTDLNTIACLNSTKKLECIDCRLCDGTAFGKHPSAAHIFIDAHGGAAVMKQVNKSVELTIANT